MKAPFILDGEMVNYISSQLDNRQVVGEPYRLKANEDKSFQGSVVVGMGFVLEPEEAQQLIENDERNRAVIFPYLNGQDLNSNPDQSPSRWVINFFDWPRERTLPGSWFDLSPSDQKKIAREGVVPGDYPDPVAADYPEPYAIVKERVYPARQNVNRQAHKKYWWHYGDKRPALYETIAPLKRVLVKSRVADKFAWAFVPNGWVYNERLVILSFDDSSQYTFVQSSIHEMWSRLYGSSLKMDMLYNPSDCFDNFPFPLSPVFERQEVGHYGETYHEHRRQLMLDRDEGLTATYNRFHDPGESAADIVRLRELHVEMDHAVAAAYGWADLALGHGFHETQQGLRYTIHDDARREVLTRLLALNHVRYAEEVKAGLHEKGKKKGVRKKKTAAKGQMGLFDT